MKPKFTISYSDYKPENLSDEAIAVNSAENTYTTVVSKKKHSGLCDNCKTRKATMNWVANGGALDFAHGMFERWCLKCATEEQLRFARERAAAIPRLEKTLARIAKREEKKEIQNVE